MNNNEWKVIKLDNWFINARLSIKWRADLDFSGTVEEMFRIQHFLDYKKDDIFHIIDRVPLWIGQAPL